MPEDLRATLESSLGDRYTLERELGGGGMARVFLARDNSLGRRVVIKVLLPELAADLSARRFERETRLAASLQQANIVPVLSAGEAGTIPFYIMPFVDGLSLRQFLEQTGRPPIERVVSILRDVARALDYAHQHGVVHRDIKPENILLSGDAAVVTDFGIAKAILVARGETAESPGAPELLTTAGLAIGTPAYMAPEQIAAGRIDHRTDLYAFGCVAYELLTGALPFTGTIPQHFLAAHLTQAPTPIAQLRPECPPHLARLAMQCLEKEPAARPQSARAILDWLDKSPAASVWDRIGHRLTRRRVAVGAILLLGVIALLGGLGRGRWWSAGPAEESAVAVLPLLNLTGEESDEYLADGIADGLATALGKLPGLRVVSRSLSYRYKGRRTIDAVEAGRSLSADLLLHGSLQGSGDRLRVSMQLTSTADNREIWSEGYDRGAGDVLAIQDGITSAIVEALRSRLTGSGAAAVAETETRDAEAYDLYLRGRFLLQRRGAGVRQAVERFEEAIGRDSAFARAHASLALALQLLPYFEPVRAADLRDRTIAAAERALGRDSTLAEAHAALALAHQHAFDWVQAETAYRRALALEPNEADAHIQFGRFLFYTGRFQEALAEFERARAIDAYSPIASGWAGHLTHLSGRPAEGLALIRRGLEIDSTSPPVLVFAAQALGAAGSREEAAGLLHRLWAVYPLWRPVAAATLARLGSPERARELLRRPDSTVAVATPLRHTSAAYLHVGLGDSARALDALEQATDAGEIWPTYYSLSEPDFDLLRSNPRFAAVVRRVRLDDRLFTRPGGGRP